MLAFISKKFAALLFPLHGRIQYQHAKSASVPMLTIIKSGIQAKT